MKIYYDKDADLSLIKRKSVAIIGASTNAKSISGQPLAHMLAAKYEGRLYPVNPNRSEECARSSFRPKAFKT